MSMGLDYISLCPLTWATFKHVHGLGYISVCPWTWATFQYVQGLGLHFSISRPPFSISKPPFSRPRLHISRSRPPFSRSMPHEGSWAPSCDCDRYSLEGYTGGVDTISLAPSQPWRFYRGQGTEGKKRHYWAQGLARLCTASSEKCCVYRQGMTQVWAS